LEDLEERARNILESSSYAPIFRFVTKREMRVNRGSWEEVERLVNWLDSTANSLLQRFLTVVATSILCTGVLNFASRVVTVTVPIYIIFATSVTETLPLTTTITTTIYADIAIPVCYITTLTLANTNTTLYNRSCYWL
jgi:hypothetical protein